MDFMQVTIPVQFIEFNFSSLFYKERDFYRRPDIVEEWFDHGVMISQPRTCGILMDSPALTIEMWTEREEQRRSYRCGNAEYVMVQIIHMMPLRLNGYDEAKLVVHEMVIVAWDCTEDWSPFKPFNECYYKARHRPEDTFFIVLDRWVSQSVLHTCRAGHLGLLFEKSMYLMMLQNSKELAEHIEDELQWGMSITIGRTVAEVSHNLEKFQRARHLVSRVFDLVDLSYILIEGDTKYEALHGARMLMTDELTAVKRPPMQSPEDSD